MQFVLGQALPLDPRLEDFERASELADFIGAAEFGIGVPYFWSATSRIACTIAASGPMMPLRTAK